MGIAFTWNIRVALGWMIVLQMAAGTLMITWATVRLRPVSRRLEDGGSRRFAWLRARPRWRLIRRPACGDWPMLWKERHTAKPGVVTQFFEILCVSAIFASIGYATYRFGSPAAREWSQYLRGMATNRADRLAFNNYLRIMTSGIELVCLIIVGGAAAEGIASERARATWDSVLATSLGGHEVLVAKMIGAIWKARWGMVLLLALWSTGLLTGSVHPSGVAAALVLLIAATWFMAAAGTYASLVSREVTQATARTMIPFIILTGTALLCFWPGRLTSVLMGAGSVPFVNWLCLVSYRDVSRALSSGSFRYLRLMAIYTNEGALRVLGTYLVAVTGYAAAAAWFTLTALNRFDRFAGRPERVAALTRRCRHERPPRRRPPSPCEPGGESDRSARSPAPGRAVRPPE